MISESRGSRSLHSVMEAGEFSVSDMVQAFNNLQMADANTGGSNSKALAAVKDPRKIARKYQLEICKKALDENIIICLGTGFGKTHIAVLLIFELGSLIRKPQNQICVFLAPTVALVEQQAGVIEASSDFKVGTYCGSSKGLSSHRDWEKEIQQHEVLVMTPQILLHNLCHCFLKMENIVLLIFDECHHAQAYSSHPYSEIMRVFYKKGSTRSPRILGMTASPIFGKGSSVSGLENLLHAKVYTADVKEELEGLVALPNVTVYYYDFLEDDKFSLHMTSIFKLEEITRQCSSVTNRKTADHILARGIKKVLSRLHGNLLFCLQHLGPCGALLACDLFLNGGQEERNELIHTDGSFSASVICDDYLTHATSILSNCLRDGRIPDTFSPEDFLESSFSPKLMCLVEILSTFRLQPNMKCIVFVNRIVVARSLSKILQKFSILSSWKCDFLVGIHSGLKAMSRKRMNLILRKFQSGELNLLVATRVGEEGLDIQTCCLVIRFDLPDNITSFIQSRGRARMPQSEYALMVERSNERELNFIKAFQEAESKMNNEIALRPFSQSTVEFTEKIYKVDFTGATISSGSSISLLHHYCAKLPRDEYFNPKPEFFYFNDPDGMVCRIILPSNAPIHEIVGLPQPSRDLAKKDTCLKACEELHKIGALTCFLLPGQDLEDVDNLFMDLSDSEDGDLRGDLHEMLVPSALREPCSAGEGVTYLNSYFFLFKPNPMDRDYKNFGLFVKAPLPAESEKMKLDLHLARGRTVLTELIPTGIVKFNTNEIVQALSFQEMFLKIILDRTEFVEGYVPLGEKSSSGSSTSYFLLPVIFDEYKHRITVEWKVIHRCLSSSIFRMPCRAMCTGIDSSSLYMHFSNGPVSIKDIENSLVYVPYRKNFFFVSGVLHDKNAYSPYKDSSNHVEHLNTKFGIILAHPEQPLLCAKQLFSLRNLVCDRKKGNTDFHRLDEHYFELAPEICVLKIAGFSKDIGSSLSLLPSIMHHLENLCVAIELRQRLCASFPEGVEVTTVRVLEALTTERCNQRFSLERLEILGDAFLKFSVARHLFLLHDTLDEGYLTRKRSGVISNANLFKMAIMHNMQVYIRDQPFDPSQFFALGRPCPVVCDEKTETFIHSHCGAKSHRIGSRVDVRCSRSHHWLFRKTVADVVEALIGAFLVDSGFKAAIAFLKWMGIEVNFESSQVENICGKSEQFIPLSASLDIPSLENLIGYDFFHKGLLLEAFVHPSYNNLGGGCYQRLEFLGDAVLDYVLTSYFYSAFQKLKPGQLTELRSLCVNNNTFAFVAVMHSLNQYIICDSSDLSEAIVDYVNFIQSHATDVEGPACPKALGDLVESSIGAILVDTGFDLNTVWNIIFSLLDPAICISMLRLNPIRELQEVCQYYGWKLQFPSSKNGNVFSVEVKIDGKYVSLSSRASNHNKTTAKTTAAEQMCAKLKDQGYKVRIKSLELEKVLSSSKKLEPKLVGYDEEPLKVRSRGNVMSKSEMDARIRLIHGKAARFFGRAAKLSSTVPDVENMLGIPFRGIGGSLKGTAKAHLYEFCAAHCWKPPLFECCKEEGPSHLKVFGFKVVVEIEEDPLTVLECFGASRMNKKTAADHAAQGVFWYLRQMGYLADTTNSH